MRVMQSLGEKMASRHVTIAIVEDVAKSGAFNEVCDPSPQQRTTPC